jgi:hypothetical protein
VPWFDENVFINKVTLDAGCPISRQTDFKKCAVKVYKADEPSALASKTQQAPARGRPRAALARRGGTRRRDEC